MQLHVAVLLGGGRGGGGGGGDSSPFSVRADLTRMWLSPFTREVARASDGLWIASFFPGLLPPSPLRMLASDNYAWVYLHPDWLHTVFLYSQFSGGSWDP